MASDKESLYVFRRFWDGVWYQTQPSPFNVIQPTNRRLQVQMVHEAALCAFVLLHYIVLMRASGCCLLSEQRGSNGTRWFLEDLEKYEDSFHFHRDTAPDTLTRTSATTLINLALFSTHYVEEELREQSNEPNWEPHQVTRFSCFFWSAPYGLDIYIKKFKF